MDRSKDRVSSNGQMDLLMLVNFSKTTSMALESISGQIIKHMRVAGLITKCMAKVSSLGLMEESMKVTFTKTRNMELVF